MVGLSDAEKHALRVLRARAEVCLSTLHRIAGVFLNGAGFLALFPVFFKDAVVVIVSRLAGGGPWYVASPLIEIYLKDINGY